MTRGISHNGSHSSVENGPEAVAVGPILLHRVDGVKLCTFDELSIEEMRSWVEISSRLWGVRCVECGARPGKSCNLEGSDYPVISDWTHAPRIVSALLIDEVHIVERAHHADELHTAPSAQPRPRPRPPQQVSKVAHLQHSALAQSVEERLRAALGDLGIDEAPERVQAALGAAGLHLDLGVVTAWLDGLRGAESPEEPGDE